MNVIKGETIQGDMLGLFRRIFVPCRVINGGEGRRGYRVENGMDSLHVRILRKEKTFVKKMQTTDNT